MSYRREDKEEDLREARDGEALVARRPTQNKVSQEKRKKKGGKKMIILRSPLAHCNQPINLFLTCIQQIYKVKYTHRNNSRSYTQPLNSTMDASACALDKNIEK
jgi:hypothetical protein